MTIFWIYWVRHIKMNSTSCFSLFKAVPRKVKITMWLAVLLGRFRQQHPR